jgi:hypothetical protein
MGISGRADKRARFTRALPRGTEASSVRTCALPVALCVSAGSRRAGASNNAATPRAEAIRRFNMAASIKYAVNDFRRGTRVSERLSNDRASSARSLRVERHALDCNAGCGTSIACANGAGGTKWSIFTLAALATAGRVAMLTKANKSRKASILVHLYNQRGIGSWTEFSNSKQWIPVRTRTSSRPSRGARSVVGHVARMGCGARSASHSAAERNRHRALTARIS